jgi:hypothetical protein
MTRSRIAAWKPGAAGVWPAAVLLIVAASILAAPSFAKDARGGQASPDTGAADSLGAPLPDDVVSIYNASIRAAMDTIARLTVNQEMLEPMDDGDDHRASAVLVYTKGEGMERHESESTIGHPKGEYTLASLVGPELSTEDYEVQVIGVEEKDGRNCYRLDVSAQERDSKHFDGSVWVTTDGAHLVRITGSVADPPFPVESVSLDKAFEPVPGGLWLLRRHTGEVVLHAGFVRRTGVIHIFYDNYSVSFEGESGAGAAR